MSLSFITQQANGEHVQMIALTRDGVDADVDNTTENDVIVDDGDLPVEDKQQEKERRKSEYMFVTLINISGSTFVKTYAY